jgi:hypothetical protein
MYSLKMLTGLILLVLLVVAGAQEEFNATELKQWMAAVEEIVSHVTLGPLKQDFTPEYVGQRTADFALRKQTRRFRAHVAQAIIESLGTQVNICIDHLTDEQAVKTVQSELKERGFEVYWLREMQECIHHGQGIMVKVPAPNDKN